MAAIKIDSTNIKEIDVVDNIPGVELEEGEVGFKVTFRRNERSYVYYPMPIQAYNHHAKQIQGAKSANAYFKKYIEPLFDQIEI